MKTNYNQMKTTFLKEIVKKLSHRKISKKYLEKTKRYSQVSVLLQEQTKEEKERNLQTDIQTARVNQIMSWKLILTLPSIDVIAF